MREIGRALGAAHLLEGSVQQAGDTVRITVQLIRAKDGTHVWSQRYDRKLRDVFRIQDEIATSVVQALEVNLPASAQRRLVQKRTENVAAYDAYLKGIALLPRRDVAEMRQALGHFERAIQLDPTYARAYVGAFDTVHLLGVYGSVSPEDRQRSTAWLERALVLAPQLGEAHISRAVFLENQGDANGAEAEYRRGIALAPGYATGHQWFGELLAGAFGRFDEALPEMDRARQLDPLSPVVRGTYIFNLGQSGRFDEALALVNKLIADEPSVARTYDDRSVLYQMKGDLVSTLRDLRRMEALDPEAYAFHSHRCMTLLDFGAMDEAEACLQPLAAKAPDALEVQGAQVLLALAQGDPNAALARVDRAPADGLVRMRPWVLLELGRDEEALAYLRKKRPQLFQTPLGKIWPGEAGPAVDSGIALLNTGDAARGRALIEAGMAAVATRPYSVFVAGRGWIEVVGHARLGDKDAAFAAMQRAIDAGFFQRLAWLDADPLLADLRKDPRYAAITAPARAAADAQVAAARKAGLL
jgi:tetratricopeptide (TPR) repeat protein